MSIRERFERQLMRVRELAEAVDHADLKELRDAADQEREIDLRGPPSWRSRLGNEALYCRHIHDALLALSRFRERIRQAGIVEDALHVDE